MANKNTKVTDESGTMKAATSETAKDNEFADYNKPMQPITPDGNKSVAGGVPGVDPGVNYAEADADLVDPKLVEAAQLRPRGAQGGSQTDRLTGIQQKMQGAGRKDEPSARGTVKVGDEYVNMAGHPPGLPGEEKVEKKGVSIRSADGRSLYVSINGQKWEGTELTVPEKYANEAKRILMEGGYYIK